MMRIQVARDNLFAQLQTVARVASTRSAIQTLAGVQLAVTDQAAELRATDLEVGLRVALDAQVEQPGTVVLPARLLLDVVRNLPSQPVTLTLRPAEQDVELLCGSSKFQMRTLRNEDFPLLPEPGQADELITVPAQPFADAIQRVARAASRDEARPVLTGILVTASEQKLCMVATDSYRLSVQETTLAEPLRGSFEANVPARALAELARIMQSSGSELLSVSVRQNQIVFELDRTLLSSRLIEGQFPNYRQLLPESYEHELCLDTAEFADIVRRISLFAQKNAPLKLALHAGELTVSAQTPDVGEATESLPVPFDGEQFEIGFNAEFFRDGIESVEADKLSLKLISPLRPGLIQTADSGSYLYLVMPIRLNV